ncbi:MAG: glycosyltransferase, partial [Terriglobales bacterium]
MTLLACFFLLIGLATAVWLRFSFQPSPLELGLGAAPGGGGLVSLVVPMRNEEQNVDCCLNSIRAQDYPHLQVIVVDDNSTDDTPAALARWKSQWPELQVLRLNDRPPGWAGKTYPEHRGSETGRGEWLLFVDADVELAPDAVSKVVAAAEGRGWPMVSVLGRLKIGSFWEAVLQLYMWALFVTLRVELPRSALVGAFLLMRRSAYREVGGYAAFPGAVTSDVAFADLLVSRGFEPRVRLCPEAYACRMYASLREIWQGCSRMLAGGTGFRGSVIAACGLLLFVLDVTPLATLLWLTSSRAHFGVPGGWLLGGAAVFALLLRWYAYQCILSRMGAPGWAFFSKPLSDVAAVLLLADAALRTATGHVTWKGHRYSKESVQVQGVPTSPVGNASFNPEGAGPAPSITVVAIAREPLDSRRADAGAGPSPIVAMAEKNPGVEFLVVTASGFAPATPPLPNVRALAASETASYALRRRGLEEAGGEVIAFTDAECSY